MLDLESRKEQRVTAGLAPDPLNIPPPALAKKNRLSSFIRKQLQPSIRAADDLACLAVNGKRNESTGVLVLLEADVPA